MPWKPNQEWPGLSTKRVADDQANGFRAEFQRLDPGAFLRSHSHPEEFEWLYVIRGDFIDSHHKMQGGDFVYRRPAVPHTAASDYGCDVLVVTNKTKSITGTAQDIEPQQQIHVLTNPRADAQAESHAPKWHASESYEGVSARKLFEDPVFGHRAVMVRLAPGAQFESDRHRDEFEQVVVLSGDCRDDQYDMSPGDYVYRRPGAAHKLSSKLGAEVLIVFHTNRS